jgi:hypothetical protein
MIEPKPTIAALLVLLATTGCTAFQRPPDRSRYRAAESGIELSEATSSETYFAVRRARTENSVVLQIIGEEQPNRILPLPPGGRSVFVSNLLEQTGVLQKLENVEVTLYRPSPHAIDGIKMAVKMNSNGDQVRPETDYALQPGDRLRVAKVEKDTFEMLMDMTLGRG